jgi:hypothetical protein
MIGCHDSVNGFRIAGAQPFKLLPCRRATNMPDDYQRENDLGNAQSGSWQSRQAEPGGIIEKRSTRDLSCEDVAHSSKHAHPLQRKNAFV